MGNRFYYGMPSTQAFQAMNALDDDMQAKTAAATAAAQAAASAAQSAASTAVQAGSARDAALAAWQASTAPNEQLAALSKQFHTGNVADTVLYDTGRDSDGGQWRYRCQHTSWENETLAGAYLGMFASEVAARGDNLLANPEDMSLAPWQTNAVTVTRNAIITADGTPMHLLAVTNTNSRSISQPITVPVTGLHAITLTLLAGNSSTVSIGVYNGAFLSFAGFTVLSGPGTLGANAAGFQNMANLSPTAPTKILAYVYLTAGVTYSYLVYPGTTANTSGNSIYTGGAKAMAVGMSASAYINSTELLSNGNFDYGKGGWVSGSTASTATVVGNEFQVTATADYGRQVLAITGLVVGKIYSLSGTVRKISGSGTALLGITPNANGQSTVAALLATTSTTGAVAFYATATTMYVAAGCTDAGSAGCVAGFDILSVKEVTAPITLSIPYSQQVGQYFQNTSDGKFYQLGPTYGATETFRGNKREFPAVALIVLEAYRMVIYDATVPSLPMWMVFNAANTVFPAVPLLGRSTVNRRCVAAMNAEILVGSNNAAEGCMRISFIDERVTALANALYTYYWPGCIAQRNAVMTVSYPASAINSIGYPAVTDFSMAVFPDAPVNPVTGLPVPSIAAACNNVLSLIRHDLSVTSLTITNNTVSTVALHYPYLSFDVTNSASHYLSAYDVRTFATHTIVYVDTTDVQRAWQFRSPNGTGNGVWMLPNRTGSGTQPLVRTRDAYAVGDSNGFAFLSENPANPANSMVAWIRPASNSGWMVGDCRGAWLADTVPETFTSADELVTNGTFTTNTAGWAGASGGTLSVSSGALVITQGTAGQFGQAQQSLTLVPGKTYRFTFTVGANGGIVQMQFNGFTYDYSTLPAGDYVRYFVAMGAAATIVLAHRNGDAVGSTVSFDNISVRVTDADRSVKGAGLLLNGSLDKTAVAPGAQLVGYSGFGASDYLEQPYTANMDFGTGDFCVMGWARSDGVAGSTQTLFSLIGTNGRGINIGRVTSSGATYPLTPYVNVIGSSGSAGAVGNVANLPQLLQGVWNHIAVMRSGSAICLYVNGVQVWSSSIAVGDISTLDGKLRLGYGFTVSTIYEMSLSLWRVGATAPSADQIAQIYQDEMSLFLPGAQCTIDGASAICNALAYDESSEALHVGTAWGRSAFRGLQRTDSVATSVGSVTALSASCGAHLTGGPGGGRYQQPPIVLRDELRRNRDVRGTSARDTMPFDFDSTAGTTDFTLPPGWSVKDVLVAGIRKRLGAARDYIVSSDGYRDTVRFAASPGAAWVQVVATRSNPG